MEGLNSTLKNEIRRAPHISLPLLSSRLRVKHLLGQAGPSEKWSDVEPTFEALLAMSLQHVAQSHESLDQEFRWDVAPATRLEIDPSTTMRPVLPLIETNPRSFAWATNQNRLWHSKFLEGNALGSRLQKCIGFVKAPAVDSKVWVCCTAIGVVGHLLCCTVVSKSKIGVDKPFVFISSERLIEQYHDKVVVRGAGAQNVWVFDVEWELTTITAEGNISKPENICDLSHEHFKNKQHK